MRKSHLVPHEQNQVPLHGSQNQKGSILPYPKTDSPCLVCGFSGNEVISVTVQIIPLNGTNVTNPLASANYDLLGLS